MNLRDNPAWVDSGRNAASREGRAAEDLLAPKTQIVADREAYLGQGRHDIGRRISDDQVELFIAGDVAASLQAEFQAHAPEFVALHDVGTSASLRLLTSLASAAGAPVQRLSIRRQGHGVALAVLQFVEMPLADGTPIRVYSSDLNANAQSRAQVARVLLGHSRLGVLLVGELPPHALTGQLQPLHEALLRGPWPNRELLMLPLGGGTALATQAAALAGRSAVAVHVTPHAGTPRQAWSFIGGAWNRLHAAQASDPRALSTELAQAVPRPQVPRNEMSTEPMPLHSPPPRAAAPAPAPVAPPLPAPAAASPLPMPVPGAANWAAYAERCVHIKGALASCVFDGHSRQVLAQAGGPPAADRLAQQGQALLAQMADSARSLGMAGGRLEGSVSSSSHHLLLRSVPGHSGVYVHLVLSASAGNLTLARMQLERIEAP